MPRQSEAVYDTTGPVLTPLNEIPDDLKQWVEDVYARQQKRPGRERVTYDSKEERDAEFKLIADYVAQRPKGILAVRRSPTKGLSDKQMDVRFTADLPANGARNAGNDRRQPVGQTK
jgi:hypothetical protein